MANCAECGRKFGWLEAGSGGLCNQCALSFDGRQLFGEVSQASHQQQEFDDAVEAVMLTTEAYPQGLVILERIEIVTAECAFGMNMFKDLFAGVRDIVGGQSEGLDYVELSGVGNMVLLVASGTAVRIEN